MILGTSEFALELAKAILTPINRDENKSKMDLETIVKDANKLFKKRGLECFELQLSNGHIILRNNTEEALKELESE